MNVAAHSPQWNFAVARRPAMLVAVLLIVGIALHNRLPPLAGIWLIGMAATLLLAGCFLRRAVISSIFLGISTLLAGVAAAQLAAYYYPRDHISAYATDDSRLAQLELRIEQPPRVLTNPFDHRRALPPKQVTSASVLRIKTTRGWEACGGDVLVQIAQPHPRLAAGQTVRAIGLLQRPSPPMNPGQFDWAHYYREQRVLASVSIAHAACIDIIHDDPPDLVTQSREKVRHLLAQGFPAAAALDHALLRALLLGDHDPQLRDVQEQFQRTGTSHHLAISGMHVAVLGGFVFLLCRLVRLSPRKAVVVATVFVVFYGTMALPSPPVVRSVVLFLAFAVGIMCRRSVDAVHLLVLSVVAMLIYHPPDLYNAGFELSFGTVLGLMIFSGPLNEVLKSRRDSFEIIAQQDAPVTPILSAYRWGDHALFEALRTGFVAWIVSMPLIAYHFEQLNPWAIFAGIVLAPVVLAGLIGGMMKVVFTLLWPSLAGTWAMVAAWPMGLMRYIVDWLAQLPASDIPVPPPSIWLIMLFYLLLLPMVVPRLRPGLRILLNLARLACLALMLVPPLQRGLSQIASSGETRVTLLAVGAGQCAVVQPPSGRTVLVDAGSTSLSDLRTKCLGPFLRHTHCTQIDTILMSHGDYDHVSAVEETVAGYGVREVLTASPFLQHATPQTRDLLAALDRMERPPRLLSPGEQIPLGRDTAIEVLWPPKEGTALSSSAAKDSNDGCLVVKLIHAGRSVLFPGDIQDGAMRELLKNPDKLKSDVLIAAHHGSSESLTPVFVRAVDPHYILSSNDRTPTNKQRDFETMIDNRPLYRTNRCGAITVIMTREGEVRVEPFLLSGK